MSSFQFMEIFGPAAEWPHQDLVAFTESIDVDLVVLGYCSGVFPMPLHDADFEYVMGWWSPINRGILRPESLRVTRSLRQSAKRYRTSVDERFHDVMAACGDPTRPGGWIDADIMKIYGYLHQIGLAHSVETWDEQGHLVGGLYGVSIGGLFAGESMFHDPELGRDASKVALMRLVSTLQTSSSSVLLDMQWLTPHLASLGGEEIQREEYLAELSSVLSQPGVDWSRDDAHTR